MVSEDDGPDPLLDLEQRIDTMQAMTDEDMGSFNWIDWLILVLFALVIPAIALEILR